MITIELPKNWVASGAADYMETHGDDNSARTGFLRDEGGRPAVVIDDDLLASDLNYYQNFRRFARTYMCCSDAFSERLDHIDELERMVPFEAYEPCDCISDGHDGKVLYNTPELRVGSVNAFELFIPDIPMAAARLIYRAVRGEDVPANIVTSPKRADEIGKWIKAQDLGVVFLQEVVNRKAFDRVAEASGYDGVYFGDRDSPDTDKYGGQSDLALLSKYPIVSHEFIPTIWQGAERDRCQIEDQLGIKHGFGIALLDVNGQEVYVVAAHGLPRKPEDADFADPSDRYTPERVEHMLEARQIVARLEATGRPIIFAGDFNFNFENDEFGYFSELFPEFEDSLLASVGRGLYTGALTTYSTDNPWVQEQHYPDHGVLDHEFTRGLSTVSATIDSSTTFSDHYPVVSVLKVSGDADSYLQAGSVPPAMIEGLIKYFEAPNIDADECDESTSLERQHATLDFLRGMFPAS
jgi:exonuclease III